MDWTLFPVYLAACFAAGATGGLFPPGEWYRSLNKPAWTPPDWVFPVVWMTIYVCISLAAARVSGLPGAGLALALWSLQIALNTLWTPIFFGLRRPKVAVVVVSALWLSVVALFVTFWQLDPLAGALIAPYVAWMSVAGALNGEIIRRNPQERGQNRIMPAE